VENRVKALSYLSFTARDRLWTSPGTLRKEEKEPFWLLPFSRLVDPIATKPVDNMVITIKSMNAIEQSLNQPVEFRVPLHAVSYGINGIHDR